MFDDSLLYGHQMVDDDDPSAVEGLFDPFCSSSSTSSLSSPLFSPPSSPSTLAADKANSSSGNGLIDMRTVDYDVQMVVAPSADTPATVADETDNSSMDFDFTQQVLKSPWQPEPQASPATQGTAAAAVTATGEWRRDDRSFSLREQSDRCQSVYEGRGAAHLRAEQQQQQHLRLRQPQEMRQPQWQQMRPPIVHQSPLEKLKAQDQGILLSFTDALLKEIDRLNDELSVAKDAETTLRKIVSLTSGGRCGGGLRQTLYSPTPTDAADQKVPQRLAKSDDMRYQALVDHIAKAIRICETDSHCDFVNCVQLVKKVLPRMPNVSENILSASHKAHKCRCRGGSTFGCIAALDDQPSNFKTIEVLVTLLPAEESKTERRNLFVKELNGLMEISPSRIKVVDSSQPSLEQTGVFSFVISDTLPLPGGGAKECSAMEAFMKLQQLMTERSTSTKSALRFVDKVEVLDNPVRGTLFYTSHSVMDGKSRRKKKVLVVEYLVVAPERQRQKIGTGLMDKLKKIAKQSLVNTIVVYSDKDATSWYKKQNFVLRTPSESRKWWNHMGNFSQYTYVDFMTYNF